MTHALITGPIQGRIPNGDSFIDVTPDVVYFDSVEEAEAAAEAIEVEHAIRGTHPLQDECSVLDDPEVRPEGVSPDVIDAHRAAHKALNKKAGI